MRFLKAHWQEKRRTGFHTTYEQLWKESKGFVDNIINTFRFSVWFDRKRGVVHRKGGGKRFGGENGGSTGTVGLAVGDFVRSPPTVFPLFVLRKGGRFQREWASEIFDSPVLQSANRNFYYRGQELLFPFDVCFFICGITPIFHIYVKRITFYTPKKAFGF